MNGELVQIAPDVHIYYSNDISEVNACFIGPVGGDLILVDTFYDSLMSGLIAAAAMLGKVRWIIHNHCHQDHCEGDHFFPNAKPLLFGRQEKMLELERNRYPASSWRTDYIKKQVTSIRLGKVNLEIEFVGGHSFDCVFINFPEQALLICGENLATGRHTMRSVPHISPFGNPYDYIVALRWIQSNSAEMVLPAHGKLLEAHQVQDVIQDNLAYLEKMRIACELARAQESSKEQLIAKCPEFETIICRPPEAYLPIAYAFHKENWERFIMAKNTASIND